MLFESPAQCFGQKGKQFRNLRCRRRVRQQSCDPAGPSSRQARLSHLHAAGKQPGYKAGDEIARTSDRLQSGNLWFGYLSEKMPVFYKMIDLSLDKQKMCRVSMPVSPPDKIRNVFIRCQQETSGIERVRRFFIGEKSQLTRIGGEQIVGVGIAAHFGDIHEPGISNEHRFGVHFFQSHQNTVVPVDVGEQVMKCDALKRGAFQG